MAQFKVLSWIFAFWLMASLAAADSPILIPSGSFSYAVSPYISIYEDASGQLEIEDIIHSKHSFFFSPNYTESLKLGVSDSNFWLRYSVHNPFSDPKEVLFSLSNSAFDVVEFYQLHDAEEYEQFLPHNINRNIHGGMLHFYTLRLRLPPQSTSTYLVKLHSKGLITSHISLMTRDQFIAGEQRYFLALGISLGLGLMALWGFLYVGTRFRLPTANYAAAFCMAVVVYLLANLGVFRLFLGMDGALSDRLAQISLALLAVFHLSAARGLVMDESYQRLFKRFITIMVVVLLAVAFLLIFVVSRAALPSIALLYVLFSFLLGTVLAATDSKTPTSQLLLLAGYFFASFTVAVFVFTSFNLLPLETVSAWGEIFIPVGVLVSLLIASVYQMPSYQKAQQPKPLDGIEGDILARLGLDVLARANSLISVNELLMDSYLNERQQEFFQNSLQFSQELQQQALLISDLGLLQQGKFELLNDNHELQTLLHQVIARVQPQATRKQVEILLNIDQDVPAYVWIDKARWQMVLYEVLSAAILLSAQGDVTIHVETLEPHSGAGICVQVQMAHLLVRSELVRNHFAIMQHQYEMLTRPPSQYWSCFLTGLLLKKMKATLEVESMTVQGASLSLVFRDVPAGASAALSKSVKQTSQLVGRSVLVVDDSATLREILTRQTQRWGMRPSSTYSGKEALAMLRNQSNLGKCVDVVIIDQDLPLMNGVTLAQRIAQDDNIQVKPKVIMLASLKPELMKEAAEIPAIDILLTKPINSDHLLASLLELI